MTLMVDRELRALVALRSHQAKTDTSACERHELEMGKWNSKYNPASLDLTIGRIPLPSKGWSRQTSTKSQAYRSDKARRVVVETHEISKCTRTVAAVGFLRPRSLGLVY